MYLVDNAYEYFNLLLENNFHKAVSDHYHDRSIIELRSTII